ncbi:MAG TPA: TonB family protein [Catalimonadaceae bacterium]|jgi:TonB family protein|nr:TonB family protein [Catalimonadaceae bacterium]
MKFFPLAALLLFTFSVSAQVKKTTPKKPGTTKTPIKPSSTHEEVRTDNFEVKETQEVRYKGTDEELVTYFLENVVFNEEAVAANAEGEVMLSFTVNFDSTVINPVVVKRFGFNVDEQMIELVKKLKFVPAKMNGVLIKQNHMISIPLRAYKKQE